MRILYHHRTQAEDGQAVHIRALQRAFRELGHEVREFALVARRDGAPAAPQRASPWALVTRAPRWVRELAEYAYGPLARGGLIRAARDLDAEVIYERYAFGNTAGITAARRLEVPLVLEVNSPMVLELSRTRGLGMPRVAERMERHIFQSADLVCVVTEVLRDMLVGMGVARERLLVTPNGVHPEAYAQPDRARARTELGLSEADGGCVLGFTGYYRDWHRLDLVLDALAAPALAEARLVLVGEGPAHAALERRARDSGLAGRVHFAGPRAHAAVPALLAAFDVALVPAINPYASPLKLYEYLAAGLAVVAPDQPNLRECLVDGDNALLVPPGDGAALTGALTRLVGDPALRERLGARARATIVERDLTWRGNARRVVDAVARLRARD
ncbi:MAG TPA: glycosyltransferase family 4 protein [Planctomycetota bacterium]|nr:glycosyltransferase family 4 protein [Planctomycetota bacterium]